MEGSLSLRSICALIAALSTTTPSIAGFDRWTAELENDPFSGGQKVSVSYMTSIRSGIFIICDTTEMGLRVRAIPGFAYDSAIADFTPLLEFAIDGQRVLNAPGSTGSVGDNLAAAEAHLDQTQAKQFTNAFAKATKQIAIKDGISDQPHLLRASGSTKTGQSLQECVGKQVSKR